MTPSSSSSRRRVPASRGHPPAGRSPPRSARAARPAARPPPASSSGKWTSPMPRSRRGSTAHRSASAGCGRAGRAPRRSSPAARATWSATSAICLPRQQGGLGVAPVDVAQVERDQPAGRVEDVGGRGVGAVGVAHDVGEHGAGALLGGEPEQPGGASDVARAAVADDLDDDAVTAEDVAPAGQVGPREVVASGGDGPARARTPGRAGRRARPPARRCRRARRRGRGC